MTGDELEKRVLDLVKQPVSPAYIFCATAGAVTAAEAGLPCVR